MGYKFTEVIPSEHLRSIVKNFFIIEFDKETSSTDYLLPDGLPSFFYIHANEPVNTYFGETAICLRDGFYVGYSNTLVKFTHKQFKITGASVFPVYFRMIFGQSPLEIINRFTRLEEIEALKEVKLLIMGSGNSGIFDLFEQYITNQLNKHQFHNDFLQVYEKLTRPGGLDLSVEELATQLGYSTRNLHSRFTQFFGMPPKKFMKLVRFNHALKYLYDPELGRNLSSVACEAGYHDQSHLIRDFKAICGKTPKEVFGDSGSLAHKFRLF